MFRHWSRLVGVGVRGRTGVTRRACASRRTPANSGSLPRTESAGRAGLALAVRLGHLPGCLRGPVINLCPMVPLLTVGSRRVGELAVRAAPFLARIRRLASLFVVSFRFPLPLFALYCPSPVRFHRKSGVSSLVRGRTRDSPARHDTIRYGRSAPARSGVAKSTTPRAAMDRSTVGRRGSAARQSDPAHRKRGVCLRPVAMPSPSERLPVTSGPSTTSHYRFCRIDRLPARN